MTSLSTPAPLMRKDKNKNNESISALYLDYTFFRFPVACRFEIPTTLLVVDYIYIYISCRVFLVHTWSVAGATLAAFCAEETFCDGSLELAWKVYGWASRRVQGTESSDMYTAQGCSVCVYTPIPRRQREKLFWISYPFVSKQEVQPCPGIPHAGRQYLFLGSFNDDLSTAFNTEHWIEVLSVFFTSWIRLIACSIVFLIVQDHVVLLPPLKSLFRNSYMLFFLDVVPIFSILISGF
jgi:hypothetical protein